VRSIAVLLAMAGLLLLALLQGTPQLAEPPPPTGEATVAGVVTGRYGPIMGVRVAVRRRGRDLAECGTDIDGAYRLLAPAGVACRVEVRPAGYTGLTYVRRTIRLQPDEERTLDIVLEPARTAGGVVTVPDQEHMTVFAIPVEHYPAGTDGGEPSLAQLYAAPKEGTFLQTGAFHLSGLGPGVYRLAVDSSRWMLPSPVVFRAGDEDIRATVVRAVNVCVEAHDFESGAPIPEFEVTCKFPGVAKLVVPAHDGWARRRVPLAGDVKDARITVRAEGYGEEHREGDTVHFVPLLRLRPPSLRLRVEDGDGAPGAFAVDGHVEDPDGDGAVDARLERREPGLFLGRAPPGTWTLVVEPHNNPFESLRRRIEVTCTPEAPWEGGVVLPPCGVVIVTGGKGSVTFSWMDEEGTRFLEPEGTEVALPPGRCLIGATYVEVTPGSRQTVALR